MARPKKELVQAAPLSRMAGLIKQLQANGVPVESASSAMAKWKYIPFVNPRARLPCISLEWLFGSCGFLAGRLLQLRATFSKGKSSFMYLEYAMAQMMANAFCLHIETEGAAAPADYVAGFGCNPNDLMTIESQSLEDCLSRIDEVICQIRGGFGGSISESTGRAVKSKFTDPLDPDGGCPIVVGVDSLSSLGKEDEASMDVMDISSTSQLSYHARKLREYFRNRVGRFRDTNTLLMLASHETAKIETGKAKGFGGGGGGGDKSSIAQNAVGGHATYGVDVNSTPYWDKEKGRQVGDTISLYTFKNKISPRYRRHDFPMIWNEGFDLIKADWEFLSSHPASPFAPAPGEKEKALYKHSHGITCKALSNKSFANEEEFLRAFYCNQDFVMSVREKLRIRGCGFDFETKYAGKEIPDALPDGVAGDLAMADDPVLLAKAAEAEAAADAG